MRPQLLIFICFVATAWGELKNVALGKPTAVSSSHHRYFNSSKAVDGIKEAYMEECFHTDKRAGKREWFMVDLQATYEIQSVNILNRADCCAKRLRNFKVVVTEKKTDHPEDSPDSTMCIHRKPSVPVCQTTELNCSHVMEGQFVYVVFMYEQYLHFCEIEVMADVTDESCELKNVALGKPTVVSSKHVTYGNSSRAVDGIKQTDLDKCFHSGRKNEELQWFMVDLERPFKVHSVNILNRADCCGWRTSNFKIVVEEKQTDHPETSPDSSVCIHRVRGLPQGEMTELKCTDIREGQYVYLVLLHESHLNFCEMEVMAEIGEITYELKNVALGKPTAVSSFNFLSPNTSKAVDGVLKTNIEECFKTGYRVGLKQWFMVHLEGIFKVQAVRILNTEHKCCDFRLRDFRVVVEETYTGHPESSPDSSVCTHRKEALPKGQVTQLNCTEVLEGQYVYVVLMHDDLLQLCEIEVMAEVSNNTCGSP